MSQELPAGIRSILRDRESSGHVGKIELNSSKEIGVDMMREKSVFLEWLERITEVQ
jgi:hypothetical protein